MAYAVTALTLISSMQSVSHRQLEKFLDRDSVAAEDWQHLAESVRHLYQSSDQQNRLLQGVMNAVQDMVYFKSIDGIYLGCNALYEAHVGVDEGQLNGKTDHDLVIEEVADKMEVLDRQAMSGNEQHLSERWMGDAEGNQICILTRRLPYFDEHGKLLGLIGVCRDITDIKIAHETITRQSNFDPLTQLPNRRYFRERLVHEIKLAQRSKLQLAVLLIGLDKFKSINETFGLEMGDAVLTQTAFRIPDVVRETDVCARIGGDEFAVVIPNLRDVTDVERIAQNLINRLAEPFRIGDDEIYATASIGIALYPDNAQDMDALIKNAGQAMYYAKSSGRSRFSHFTFALQEAAARRGRLSRELRRAVSHHKFEMLYQPIVELATGGVRRAEALVLWNHEGRGLIGPMEFIPLAEDSGAMVEIGDWIFRQAAQQAKHLRETFDPDFAISVNQSPVLFRNPQAKPSDWVAYMAELGLPGQAIVLELTEAVFMKAEEIAKSKLEAFRDAGFQMAIDDFGTGYASVAYLKKFDLDYVKIDQTFVQDIEDNASARVLCEAIIAMAHKMGLKVIAEGVETEAQRQFLLDAGCNYAQGYLFSKPLGKSDFDRLLQKLKQNQSA